MKKTDKNATDQIGYYFRKEKWLLLTVTITGILYNIGMVAGPWFEGQMVQYLCDIIGGKKRPSAMVSLVVCYVLTIFLYSLCDILSGFMLENLQTTSARI